MIFETRIDIKEGFLRTKCFQSGIWWEWMNVNFQDVFSQGHVISLLWFEFCEYYLCEIRPLYLVVSLGSVLANIRSFIAVLYYSLLWTILGCQLELERDSYSK